MISRRDFAQKPFLKKQKETIVNNQERMQSRNQFQCHRNWKAVLSEMREFHQKYSSFTAGKIKLQKDHHIHKFLISFEERKKRGKGNRWLTTISGQRLRDNTQTLLHRLLVLLVMLFFVRKITVSKLKLVQKRERRERKKSYMAMIPSSREAEREKKTKKTLRTGKEHTKNLSRRTSAGKAGKGGVSFSLFSCSTAFTLSLPAREESVMRCFMCREILLLLLWETSFIVRSSRRVISESEEPLTMI